MLIYPIFAHFFPTVNGVLVFNLFPCLVEVGVIQDCSVGAHGRFTRGTTESCLEDIGKHEMVFTLQNMGEAFFVFEFCYHYASTLSYIQWKSTLFVFFNYIFYVYIFVFFSIVFFVFFVFFVIRQSKINENTYNFSLRVLNGTAIISSVSIT